MSAMSRRTQAWIAGGIALVVVAVLWSRSIQRAAGLAPGGDASSHAASSSAVSSSAASSSAAPTRAAPSSAAPSRAAPTDSAATLPTSTATEKPSAWGERAGSVAVRVVRDEDGAPIADARVHFGDERGVPTDANGMARVPFPRDILELLERRTPGSPPPALPAIVVRAPGRAESSATAPSPDTMSVPTVVVRLAAARTVRVRLADPSGAPLDAQAIGIDDAALVVTLGLGATCGLVGGTFDGGGGPLYRVRPESWDGSRFAWTVEVRGTGSPCLHALLGDEILAAEPLPPALLDVVLRVDPAAFARAAAPFAVLVTDDAQRPLAHARVVAKLAHGPEIVRETGADGRARVEHALATEFGLAVAADGFVAAEQRVGRPIRADVVVRLVPGRAVRGHVVDKDGHPFRNQVGLYRATQLGTRTQPIATTEADAQGRFEFLSAPRDALVVVGLGSGDGRGFLPPRESLPPTATWIDAGADASDVSVQALFHEEF